MCTVSWQFHPEGYELFFSRDEQRSRPPGEPPRPHRRNGTSWLAPRDPQGGGSWIVSNTHGLTACVLNAYGMMSPVAYKPATHSRGAIPPALAMAHDLPSAQEILKRLLLSGSFAPCFIFCLFPSTPAAWWIWNGTVLHRVGGLIHPPLTTSSYDSARVTRARREAFHRMVRSSHEATSEQLRRFHECPEQIADAATVRMSRPDARTVCLTRVSVSTEKILMAYAERDGDEDFLPARETALPRLIPQAEVIECHPC